MYVDSRLGRALIIDAQIMMVENINCKLGKLCNEGILGRRGCAHIPPVPSS